MVRQTLIYMNLDELYCYQFIISINRCHGSCNDIVGLFGRISVPNNMEDVKLKVFNMIKEINESRTLPKHISCKRRYEFDGRKCNSRQKMGR